MSYAYGPGIGMPVRPSETGLPEQFPVTIQEVNGTGHLLNFTDINGNVLSFVDSNGAFNGATAGPVTASPPFSVTGAAPDLIVTGTSPQAPYVFNTSMVQFIDQNAGKDVHFAFTKNTTADSGLEGIHLGKASTDTLPVGMTLEYTDTGPLWDTTAIDATTSDLVLAYSHALMADNFRFRRDTAQAALGPSVGQPPLGGPQLSIFGGTLAIPKPGLSITQNSGGDYGLQLLTAAANKRTKIIFQAQSVTGWQMGTDSGTNGTNDFWLFDNSTGGFPIVAKAAGNLLFGETAAGPVALGTSPFEFRHNTPMELNLVEVVAGGGGGTAGSSTLVFSAYNSIFAGARKTWDIQTNGTLSDAGVLSNSAFILNCYQQSTRPVIISGSVGNEIDLGDVDSIIGGTQVSIFNLLAANSVLRLDGAAAQAGNLQEWALNGGAASLAVLPNARDFSFLDAAGTKLGAAGQKVGFLGATPVVRQTGASAAAIAAIIDANAKSAVSALQTALANLGLVTSPA